MPASDRPGLEPFALVFERGADHCATRRAALALTELEPSLTAVHIGLAAVPERLAAVLAAHPSTDPRRYRAEKALNASCLPGCICAGWVRDALLFEVEHRLAGHYGSRPWTAVSAPGGPLDCTIAVLVKVLQDEPVEDLLGFAFDGERLRYRRAAGEQEGEVEMVLEPLSDLEARASRWVPGDHTITKPLGIGSASTVHGTDPAILAILVPLLENGCLEADRSEFEDLVARVQARLETPAERELAAVLAQSWMAGIDELLATAMRLVENRTSSR